ncbi:MAG TPA: archaeosortase/exosortase family protein, partial [Opitutaceae bacterium]|nr:archaeosortase/exosortase family protein [Opitutaceae bacterium]
MHACATTTHTPVFAGAPAAPMETPWWQTRAALLAATALAGWPVVRWFIARIGDGSDEPWGLVALVLAIAFLPWRRLREPVPPRWLAAAAVPMIVVLLGYEVLPPLVRAGAWALTLACLLGGTGPLIARSGLLVLALPVVATAQFYLGYPLRALTAACSLPLLRLLGYVVERQGTALHWAGETVLIDAPCSGIQMLWSGLTTGCVLALVWRLDDRASLRLLRQAAGIVALANILRCVALFLLEIRGRTLPEWLHEGVGLALFATALGAIAWLAARAGSRSPAAVERGCASCHTQVGGRVWLLALLLGLSALRPLIQAKPVMDAGAPAEFPGWPTEFEGRPLTALAPSEREARFAAGFPGRIAAFSDGERTVLFRWVSQETRKLHPAIHCLRGLGYAVQPGAVWAGG